jgi:hypothetical protein
MHYGVPIICGEDFSLKEVGGNAVYLIDPRKPISLSNALAAVSSEPEVRAKLIQRGRERLCLFDIRVAAAELLNAFRSATRTENDFPRPPRYVKIPELIIAPTPASSDPWTIEIQYEAGSSTKCVVYLNNLPFASFASENGTRNRFSFVCRPEGRTLAIKLADTNRQIRPTGHANISITKVVAKQTTGAEVLLYGASGTRVL